MLLIVLSAVVSYVTCRPVAPVEVYPTRRVVVPAVYHFSDLPREVFYGRVLTGQVVTVSYPFRLQSTADPHVYHFQPGTPNVPSPRTIANSATNPPSPGSPSEAMLLKMRMPP